MALRHRGNLGHGSGEVYLAKSSPVGDLPTNNLDRKLFPCLQFGVYIFDFATPLHRESNFFSSTNKSTIVTGYIQYIYDNDVNSQQPSILSCVP